MKNKHLAVTLDLESDHSGLLRDEYHSFGLPDRIEELLTMLDEEGVKLSVFVVGEVLEKFPAVIELFRSHGTEFHGHSYSHDPGQADSAEEVRKCRRAFEEYFNHPPIGYRAPLGKISDQGIENLQKEGFKFDASIFPSYHPNPLKYLFSRKSPHMYGKSSVLEIPNSSLTPFLITFSISYIKLLGFNLYRILMNLGKIPDVLVFGCHLHDYFTTPEMVARLPRFWRFVYSRNRSRGMEYTRRMVRIFKKRGYAFVHMSEVYAAYKKCAKDEGEHHE